ncbi:MAG: CapA family protein [Emergencia sp.]
MSKDFSLGFTGDLSFSGYFADQYHNDQLIAPEIREFLNSADHTVINYESPITPCRQTKKRRLTHRSDPRVLDFIKDNIHNPVISLANNHMMDFRSIGIIDSVSNVEASGIPFIGAGRTMDEASRCLIVGNEDIKIGIIALQYKGYKIREEGRYAGPFSEDHDQFLKKRIDEVRSKVDWLVLVYHGGDEFLYAPMPYIRKLLKKYLNWGCDVIVAHHPHVVQGYEYFGKKAVFYSLGNFIFDTDYQRTQEGTEKGMTLKLTFTKDDFSFENMPIFIDRETITVRKGEDDPHFCDITHMNYGQLWKTEALRKETVKQKAKDLKVLEITQRKEKAVDEYMRFLQLKKAIELQNAKEEIDAENSLLYDDDRDADYEIPDLIDTNQETQEADSERDSDTADNESLRRELRALTEKYDLNYANEIANLLEKQEAAKYDDAPPPKPAAKKMTPRKLLRKAYTKLIVNRKTNYRQIVVILGGKWAKLFYRNKKMFG